MMHEAAVCVRARVCVCVCVCVCVTTGTVVEWNFAVEKYVCPGQFKFWFEMFDVLTVSNEQCGLVDYKTTNQSAEADMVLLLVTQYPVEQEVRPFRGRQTYTE